MQGGSLLTSKEELVQDVKIDFSADLTTVTTV